MSVCLISVSGLMITLRMSTFLLKNTTASFVRVVEFLQHVATEAEPILSHLFGAEFGLEILLETGRLSSQLFSDWSVLCCSRTKLGSKNCHTIFGAEFGAAAPLLSQRAHTAHAFESQKPPL